MATDMCEEVFSTDVHTATVNTRIPLPSLRPSISVNNHNADRGRLVDSM
jgi:hypothetical protein